MTEQEWKDGLNEKIKTITDNTKELVAYMETIEKNN